MKINAKKSVKLLERNNFIRGTNFTNWFFRREDTAEGVLFAKK